jgi:hypothetical protein
MNTLLAISIHAMLYYPQSLKGSATMTAATIRTNLIEYVNELPEEKLPSLLDYVRFLCEKRNPAEVTTLEEVYQRIDEGLDDLAHNRSEPFEDTMRDLREMVAQYEL